MQSAFYELLIDGTDDDGEILLDGLCLSNVVQLTNVLLDSCYVLYKPCSDAIVVLVMCVKSSVRY